MFFIFFLTLLFYPFFALSVFFGPFCEGWHVEKTWDKITVTPPNKKYRLSARLVELSSNNYFIHFSTNNHFPASPDLFETILKSSFDLDSRIAALNQLSFWKSTVKTRGKP